MSNYIEEKLIDIYESDDYKEAVREQMFGLLSFKKEEQFNAYIDVLMIILRNHIRIALQEQEDRIREEEYQRRKREKCKTAEANYVEGYNKARIETKEKLLRIVIEDVPHKYQERLLKELNI